MLPQNTNDEPCYVDTWFWKKGVLLPDYYTIPLRLIRYTIIWS